MSQMFSRHAKLHVSNVTHQTALAAGHCSLMKLFACINCTMQYNIKCLSATASILCCQGSVQSFALNTPPELSDCAVTSITCIDCPGKEEKLPHAH